MPTKSLQLWRGLRSSREIARAPSQRMHRQNIEIWTYEHRFLISRQFCDMHAHALPGGIVCILIMRRRRLRVESEPADQIIMPKRQVNCLPAI